MSELWVSLLPTNRGPKNYLFWRFRNLREI